MTYLLHDLIHGIGTDSILGSKNRHHGKLLDKEELAFASKVLRILFGGEDSGSGEDFTSKDSNTLCLIMSDSYLLSDLESSRGTSHACIREEEEALLKNEKCCIQSR